MVMGEKYTEIKNFTCVFSTSPVAPLQFLRLLLPPNILGPIPTPHHVFSGFGLGYCLGAAEKLVFGLQRPLLVALPHTAFLLPDAQQTPLFIFTARCLLLFPSTFLSFVLLTIDIASVQSTSDSFF